MIYPVIFKDKCSCGGKLVLVLSGMNGHNNSDDTHNKTGCSGRAILGMKCSVCGVAYQVKWDLESGEPTPIISRKSALSDFLAFYANCK